MAVKRLSLKEIWTIILDGWKGTGRLKKRWMDCVKNPMKGKGVSDSMTVNRMEWKKKILKYLCTRTH